MSDKTFRVFLAAVTAAGILITAALVIYTAALYKNASIVEYIAGGR
ncbi:MAG: hypothetical protein NC078_07290 [Ruminococcus sp.]|nr:hypothetical protein [Ruminococcus sp.]